MIVLVSYEEFVVERYKMTSVRYSYSGYNKGLASCLAMLIYAMFYKGLASCLAMLIYAMFFTFFDSHTSLLWRRPIKNNVTKLPPALNIAYTNESNYRGAQ